MDKARTYRAIDRNTGEQISEHDSKLQAIGLAWSLRKTGRIAIFDHDGLVYDPNLTVRAIR